MFRLVHEPARRLGLRIIAPERPGFGLSTFQHNRTLADWASDITEFANHLGLKHFGVAGISGGGPYAAACAALLPSRVTATALINPVGPLCAPEGPEKIGMTRFVIFRVLPRANLAMKGFFALWRLMFLHAPDSMYDILKKRACAADKRILLAWKSAGTLSIACRKACGLASVVSSRRCGFSAGPAICPSMRWRRPFCYGKAPLTAMCRSLRRSIWQASSRAANSARLKEKAITGFLSR